MNFSVGSTMGWVINVSCWSSIIKNKLKDRTSCQFSTRKSDREDHERVKTWPHNACYTKHQINKLRPFISPRAHLVVINSSATFCKECVSNFGFVLCGDESRGKRAEHKHAQCSAVYIKSFLLAYPYINVNDEAWKVRKLFRQTNLLKTSMRLNCEENV